MCSCKDCRNTLDIVESDDEESEYNTEDYDISDDNEEGDDWIDNLNLFKFWDSFLPIISIFHALAIFCRKYSFLDVKTKCSG